MGTIKAIETEYAGHLFRSRLEARWAVFFDQAKIEWKYEPQGYRVGKGDLPYLPDFWLPKSQLWVEVKGAFDMESLALVGEAAGPEGLPLSLDEGSQRPVAIAPCGSDTWRVAPIVPRILILGEVPKVEPDHAWVHPIVVMVSGNHVAIQSGYFWAGRVRRLADIFGIPADPDLLHHNGFPIYELAHGSLIPLAYRAARSARFEHGESGAML